MDADPGKRVARPLTHLIGFRALNRGTTAHHWGNRPATEPPNGAPDAPPAASAWPSTPEPAEDDRPAGERHDHERRDARTVVRTCLCRRARVLDQRFLARGRAPAAPATNATAACKRRHVTSRTHAPLIANTEGSRASVLVRSTVSRHRESDLSRTSTPPPAARSTSDASARRSRRCWRSIAAAARPPRRSWRAAPRSSSRARAAGASRSGSAGSTTGRARTSAAAACGSASSRWPTSARNAQGVVTHHAERVSLLEAVDRDSLFAVAGWT